MNSAGMLFEDKKAGRLTGNNSSIKIKLKKNKNT